MHPNARTVPTATQPRPQKHARRRTPREPRHRTVAANRRRQRPRTRTPCCRSLTAQRRCHVSCAECVSPPVCTLAPCAPLSAVRSRARRRSCALAECASKLLSAASRRTVLPRVRTSQSLCCPPPHCASRVTLAAADARTTVVEPPRSSRSTSGHEMTSTCSGCPLLRSGTTVCALPTPRHPLRLPRLYILYARNGATGSVLCHGVRVIELGCR